MMEVPILACSHSTGKNIPQMVPWLLKLLPRGFTCHCAHVSLVKSSQMLYLALNSGLSDFKACILN